MAFFVSRPGETQDTEPGATTFLNIRMDKDKFLNSGLIEQYVLGLTDERESEEVERYAEAFPEIKTQLESMRKAMDEYARQYTNLPPEELRTRMMKGTGESEEGRPKGKGSAGRGGWLARGTMALLIVLSLLFYQRKVVADREYKALSEEYQSFQKECSRRQEELQKLNEVYVFLKHENTVPVRLMSTGLVKEVEAVAYFNQSARKVFINPTHLPAPPEGNTYQIWADVGGKMVSMGLIDGHSRKIQPVAFIEGSESLNITLEPEGGSEEPTVAMLYVSGGL